MKIEPRLQPVVMADPKCEPFIDATEDTLAVDFHLRSEHELADEAAWRTPGLRSAVERVTLAL